MRGNGAVSRGKWRGRDAYTLSNDLVRVVTLTGGGHIAELCHVEATGVSPLWVPPWPTIEPYLYRERRHAAQYGSTTEGKLLSGITGHNICLDYFGSPSSEEAAQGLSQHGEAPNSRWFPGSQCTTDSGVELNLWTRLPQARLRFERILTLSRGEPVVYFKEKVTNLAKADHFFHWTQHVTLGPPFLTANEVSISIPGTRGMTFPHGYDEGKALLDSAREFSWPHTPTKDGRSVDLSQPLSRVGLGYVVGVLLDPKLELAFVAALNQRLGLLLAYCFPRIDFPWVAIWEENKAIQAAPWKGETVALGLEFGTTPLPVPRRENFTRGGPLFGVPTVAYVPARSESTREYLALLVKVPEGFAGVRSITAESNEIVIHSNGPAQPIRVLAARLQEIWPELTSGSADSKLAK